MAVALAAAVLVAIRPEATARDRVPSGWSVQLQPAATSADGASLTDVLASIGSWTEAPDYVALFAPKAERSAYRAFVSRLNLEQALGAVITHPSILHPPGAWEARTLGAVDAFGTSGPYNRWTAAMLYGPRSARVARGPRGVKGQVRESWTLVSPYPAIDFSHLEEGTLLLVTRLTPTEPAPPPAVP